MPLSAPVKQPEGFVTVDEALQKPDKTLVNIIGVVEQLWPVATTSGSDLQFTMAIQDRSVTESLGQGVKLKVKFFIGNEHDAPKVEAIGDTVLLRGFKMMRNRSGTALLKSWGSECIVFPSSTMPDPHFNDSYAAGQILNYSCKPANAKPPTAEQQMWAISLRHSLSPQQVSATRLFPDRPGRELGKKFSHIKDIGPDQFFDLIVEVVRMYPVGQEMYVTDYTENNLLYRYNHPDEKLDLDMERDGDTYGYTEPFANRQWPGPYGQMTLQIKLWEPHASLAFSRVREGDLVQLKNVHVKMDRSGGKIEGALHQDQRYPDKVNIHKKLPSARAIEIKSRKEDYLARLKKQEQRGQAKQKRKEKKRKKGKSTGAYSEDQADESDGKVNSHVKCERPQDPLMRLLDIESNDKRLYRTPSGVDCELPFINAAYRARVRVVDFWPQNLEDFSKSLEDREYNDINAEGETQSSTSYSALSAGTQRWEWHFCLLVEDAKQRAGTKDPVRMPLLVFDKDAEYLLRLDATDLRKDNKTLKELREKLFILWGNLEELKVAGQDPLEDEVAKKHSSNAFECCIQEAGAKAGTEAASDEPKYQRIYHLCGTTINR